MTSKAKKRVVLPTRPEPPTIEQILEDIQGTLSTDPVFLSLEEPTEGSLQPSVSGREEECVIESDREQQYQQSRSFVAMNNRLQEIQALLKTTREQLKEAGESLESNIAEIKERTLYDFSIWYCEEDEYVATCICRTLEQEGFQGYCEHRDQVAGVLVISGVCDVIQTSRVSILILSNKSIGDRWCQRISEWNVVNIVENNRAKIIPVYVNIEQAQGPLILRSISSLSYYNKYFKKRLLDSLKRRR